MLKFKNSMLTTLNQVIDDEIPMFYTAIIHNKAKLTKGYKRLINE